ncbi:MAG: GIY-YIG nuclease family protein [Candidatus Riflebacteria bacterium]|nr:GIY-YIG nuclease family protein [Candidatus Riflebacteria bacterium]
MQTWTVYIIECLDGTYYTGITCDLKRRFQEHTAGSAAKYTRSHKPARIVYSEIAACRSEALKREIAIKKLSREKKEKLISE